MAYTALHTSSLTHTPTYRVSLARQTTTPGGNGGAATSQLNFAPAYQMGGNTFFPSLRPRQIIPQHVRSRYAQSGRDSHVGMGMVLAVCSLLNPRRVRSFAVAPSGIAPNGQGDPERWLLTLESFSRPGEYYQIGGTDSTWWYEHNSYLIGITALVDSLTVSRGDALCQEVIETWGVLLSTLRTLLGGVPPYSEAQVIQASQSQTLTELMMQLTDALYFSAKQRSGSLSCLPQPSSFMDPHQLGAFESWIYNLTTAPTQPNGSQVFVGSPNALPLPVWPITNGGILQGASGMGGPQSGNVNSLNSVSPAPVLPIQRPAASSGRVDTSVLATLRRCFRRGSTALLIGPTGIGKSSVVRLAAVEEQVALVMIKGRPGLEDRDMYGKNYPILQPDGSQIFKWVDGPLTLAWRAAASGRRVALLFDELARFDPYNLAPLTGALDRVSGREVKTILGITDTLREQVDPSRDYRLLELPNGEILAAEARFLSIIATTNLGSDYTQSQREFDSALLNRFELQLEMQRLEPQVRRQILREQHALPDPVASLMVALEDFTIHNSAAVLGLLRRELNLRKSIDWAVVASELVVEGMTWNEGLRVAAEQTVLGFCCSRADDGTVDRSSSQLLRDEIRRQSSVLSI